MDGLWGAFFLPKHKHEFGDGGFGGDVVAAEDSTG
jgi:hypothetical protein